MRINTKETLKGVAVIILAPIVYSVVATLGNIIGSLWNGDFTDNRTELSVFFVSGMLGFVLVNIISYSISSKKIYYIIGQILNLVLLIWGMVLENYDLFYYSVPLVGLWFLFQSKTIIKKSS